MKRFFEMPPHGVGVAIDAKKAIGFSRNPAGMVVLTFAEVRVGAGAINQYNQSPHHGRRVAEDCQNSRKAFTMNTTGPICEVCGRVALALEVVRVLGGSESTKWTHVNGWHERVRKTVESKDDKLLRAGSLKK